MQAGEAIATIAVVATVIVVMRRRGEGWGRTIGAGVVAWFGSAVLIVAWELVFAVASRAVAPPPSTPPAASRPIARPTEPPYMVDWVAACKPISTTRLAEDMGLANCADGTTMALTSEDDLRRAQSFRWTRADAEFLPDEFDWIVQCDPVGGRQAGEARFEGGLLQCRDGSELPFAGAQRWDQVFWWQENMIEEGT